MAAEEALSYRSKPTACCSHEHYHSVGKKETGRLLGSECVMCVGGSLFLGANKRRNFMICHKRSATLSLAWLVVHLHVSNSNDDICACEFIPGSPYFELLDRRVSQNQKTCHDHSRDILQDCRGGHGKCLHDNKLLLHFHLQDYLSLKL